MQAERDLRARRTWGRAAPATRHWRRERELRAFGASASNPFSRAECHGAQPGPEATSPSRAPRLDAPARPRCLRGLGFQEHSARASQRRKCSSLLFGRLVGRSAGSPEWAASEMGCSQSTLSVGPVRAPRLASLPGTPTWSKFLDDSETGTSSPPALQALHHATVEVPGLGRYQGDAHAWRSRNGPSPSPGG